MAKISPICPSGVIDIRNEPIINSDKFMKKAIQTIRSILVALALSFAVFSMTWTSMAAENDKAPTLSLVNVKFADACCESSCADIDKKLTSIKGIQAPKTCSTSKTTTLKYDPQVLKDNQLFAALKKAGLKVEAQFTTLEVNGMACTSCSSRVNKALTSIQGVKTNEVCHESGKAKISFDPALVSEKKLIESIQSLGYKASVLVAQAQPAAAPKE